MGSGAEAIKHMLKNARRRLCSAKKETQTYENLYVDSSIGKMSSFHSREDPWVGKITYYEGSKF